MDFYAKFIHLLSLLEIKHFNSMANHYPKYILRKESGAVLLTGLIFLLVLSLIVLSMLRSGTLEERMAANARNRQVAIQAAEAVLRDAEVQLFSTSAFISNFDSLTLANGFYSAPASTATPRWKDSGFDWSSSTATRTFASTASAIDGVSSEPKYIVEIISPPTRPNSTVPCSKGIAHVTARGVGNDSSTVFLQAIYRYQSNRVSDGC
jgi:type IV pilus assembly protein PilX